MGEREYELGEVSRPTQHQKLGPHSNGPGGPAAGGWSGGGGGGGHFMCVSKKRWVARTTQSRKGLDAGGWMRARVRVCACGGSGVSLGGRGMWLDWAGQG